MVTGQEILSDADLALQGMEQALPALLGVVALWNPQVAAFMKFLPVIEASIKGVDTVAQAVGGNLASSQGAVIDHLTPGAPAASALQ